MQEPLHTIQENHKKKKLVVFDLDGTLAESKADIDDEMVILLTQLLQKKDVAVIGGGNYELFERQILSRLKEDESILKKLFLFPTTSSTFYRFSEGIWHRVYSKTLSEEERKKIFKAFAEAFKRLNYKNPEKIYGEVIEDRETQVTFSALGQQAPVDAKEEWKRANTDMKMKIAMTVQEILPEFEVRAAGFTSIDVTRKGVDKEYGIRQIEEHLGIPLEDMIFIGDALFPGGNDSAVLRTGVPCIEVSGPEDTKKVIKDLLSE